MRVGKRKGWDFRQLSVDVAHPRNLAQLHLANPFAVSRDVQPPELFAGTYLLLESGPVSFVRSSLRFLRIRVGSGEKVKKREGTDFERGKIAGVMSFLIEAIDCGWLSSFRPVTD